MAKPKLAAAPAPAPTAVPARADKAEAAPAPKKKSKKLLVIVIAALLLIGGGGGGAWFYFGRSPAEAKHEPQAEKQAPPTFVTLESFTVNLLEESGDHYLQVGIVYQVADGKVVDTMKLYMPVLRNRILLLLSGKRPSEIAAPDGKQKLVAELVAAARESLPGATPERGVDSAFLSAFVIQ
jgi:flagellar FliL protein